MIPDGSFMLPEGGVCFAGVVPNPMGGYWLEQAQKKDAEAFAAVQALYEAKRELAAKMADDAVKRLNENAKLNARIAELRGVCAGGLKAFKRFDLKKRRNALDKFHPLLEEMVNNSTFTVTNDQLKMLGAHFPVVFAEVSRWCASNWVFANEKDGHVSGTDVAECGSQIGIGEAELMAFFTSTDGLRSGLAEFDAGSLLLVEYWSRAVAAAWARVHEKVVDAVDYAHSWVSLADDAKKKHSVMEFPPLASGFDGKNPKCLSV